jgi:hypothetical protein
MIDVPSPPTGEEYAAATSEAADLTRKDLCHAVRVLRRAADDPGLNELLAEVHKSIIYDCWAVDANPDTDVTEFDATVLRRGGNDGD